MEGRDSVDTGLFPPGVLTLACLSPGVPRFKNPR